MSELNSEKKNWHITASDEHWLEKEKNGPKKWIIPVFEKATLVIRGLFICEFTLHKWFEMTILQS
jgi:hypothetical protein